MPDDFTYKTRHNGFNYVTDIFYQGKRCGHILHMSCTAVWRDDKLIPCTDFRVFRHNSEQVGKGQSLEIAQALVEALHRQKQEIGRYAKKS